MNKKLNRLTAKTIKISVGSGKMSGLASLNTNSRTNPFCIKQSKCSNTVCSSCYSNRLLSFRKSLYNKVEQNSKLLSKKLLTDNQIPKLNYKYFRFNSFGEIINKIHLLNLIEIAKHNSSVKFGLWTKRHKLISSNKHLIPDNIILIFSNKYLDRINYDIPKGFHKVFNVVTKEFIKKNLGKHSINCQKKCITCLKCYRFSDDQENNCIIELKK